MRERLHDGVPEKRLAAARAGSEEHAASEVGERLARRRDEGEDDLGRQSVALREPRGYHPGVDLVDVAQSLAFAEKNQSWDELGLPWRVCVCAEKHQSLIGLFERANDNILCMK